MLAPGAMLCAHSTSRVVSPPQPVMSELFLFHAGTGCLFGLMILNDGGAGRPYALSKTPRSWAIVGDPNASTITIVSPLPVTLLAYTGARLLAARICCGLKQSMP